MRTILNAVRGSLLPAAVVVAAVALRLFNLHYVSALTRDSCYYLEIAEVIGGRGWAALLSDCHTPPLFLIVLSTLKVLGVDLLFGGVALNIVLGAVLVVFVYRLAYFVTARREVALLAMLLAAVNPALIGFSTEIIRENLYLLCMFGGALLILHYVGSGRVIFIALSAVFFAAAFLTRFEALEALFLIPLFLVVAAPKKFFRLGNLRAAALFCLVFGFVTLTCCLLLPGGHGWRFLGAYCKCLKIF